MWMARGRPCRASHSPPTIRRTATTTRPAPAGLLKRFKFFVFEQGVDCHQSETDLARLWRGIVSREGGARPARQGRRASDGAEGAFAPGG